MKINFFSQLLLLTLNVCYIFAAEQNSKTLGKLSPLTQKMAKKATEEERIRKILNDHPDAYVMLGIKQVKITEEMMRGADIAGNVHEEWLKKNLLQNEQLSSEEDDVCCTVTLKFKW